MFQNCFLIILFKTLILFCIWFASVDSYMGIIAANPDVPGKCIYRGDLLTTGIHSGPAPCQRLTCRPDGSILIEGCGKLWLENCNRGERKNVGKPYPECCQLIYKCKKSDGSSFYIEKDTYNNVNTHKQPNTT